MIHPSDPFYDYAPPSTPVDYGLLEALSKNLAQAAAATRQHVCNLYLNQETPRMSPIPTAAEPRERRSSEYPEDEAAAIVATLTPEEADRFCLVRDAREYVPGTPGTPVMIETVPHMGQSPITQPHPRKTTGAVPAIPGVNAKYDMRGPVKQARLALHAAAGKPVSAEPPDESFDIAQERERLIEAVRDVRDTDEGATAQKALDEFNAVYPPKA